MYQAALAIAREVGNRRREGVVLGFLGALEREQGRLDEARDHYDQALAIHRAVGNRRYEGAVLAHLGDLLAQCGQRDQARALLAVGEAHLRELGENLELAALLCVRGHLELDAGEWAKAAAALEEAVGNAAAVGVEPDSQLWKDIAKLRDAIGSSSRSPGPAGPV